MVTTYLGTGKLDILRRKLIIFSAPNRDTVGLKARKTCTKGHVVWAITLLIFGVHRLP